MLISIIKASRNGLLNDRRAWLLAGWEFCFILAHVTEGVSVRLIEPQELTTRVTGWIAVCWLLLVFQCQ